MNHNQHPDGQWQEPGEDWQQPQQPRSRAGVVNPESAAFAIDEERGAFIRRTYAHLMGAIFTCVAMMMLFMMSPAYEPVMIFMFNSSWLLVLGIFIGFSWMGDAMARRVDSKGLQYIGLLVGVGAYAIILSMPVAMVSQPGMGGAAVLIQALGLTGIVFTVLTAVVLITAKDFSVLRTGIIVMTVLAFGAIIAGSLFGFTLGLGFSVMMVGYASAIIVYQTSSMVHVYRTDQHVAAALGLFSSIGLLFWYILSILSFD